MAVYTPLTQQQVEEFLRGYDLGGLQSFAGIEKGVSNTNFDLRTVAGHFILTIFEPRRVKPDDVPFFLAYADFLAGSGIPCPRIVKGRAGNAVAVLEGKPAAIVMFLEGKDVAPAEITADICGKAGALAGRMHRAGEKFPQQRANWYGLRQWQRWQLQMDTRLNEISYGLCDAVRGELMELENLWPEDLPAGAVHADLFPDNVFFSGGAVSGVIDFHFACTDLLAYDLAIIANAWCFDTKYEFCEDRFAALLDGYKKERALSAAERAALPVLLRGAALRFLLSRCEEALNHKPGDLMKPHDPLAFLKRLEFFQDAIISC